MTADKDEIAFPDVNQMTDEEYDACFRKEVELGLDEADDGKPSRMMRSFARCATMPRSDVENAPSGMGYHKGINQPSECYGHPTRSISA
jgi:hypothetical protein